MGHVPTIPMVLAGREAPEAVLTPRVPSSTAILSGNGRGSSVEWFLCELRALLCCSLQRAKMSQVLERCCSFLMRCIFRMSIHKLVNMILGNGLRWFLTKRCTILSQTSQSLKLLILRCPKSSFGRGEFPSS